MDKEDNKFLLGEINNKRLIINKVLTHIQFSKVRFKNHPEFVEELNNIEEMLLKDN
jgi:hypothetical protein